LGPKEISFQQIEADWENHDAGLPSGHVPPAQALLLVLQANALGHGCDLSFAGRSTLPKSGLDGKVF
jgi:hypothetical protein